MNQVLSLSQATRFDNANSLALSHTVTRGAVTLSPSLLTNSSGLAYGHTLALTVNVGLFTNSPSLAFGHTVTPGARTLSPSLFSNTNSLALVHVVSHGLTQSARYNNANSLALTHTVTPGARTLSPSLFTNSHAYYTHIIALYSQYPDPSEVLAGVVYGPPGSPLVGTYTAAFDDSPKMDITTGRMVKVISNTKALSL